MNNTLSPRLPFLIFFSPLLSAQFLTTAHASPEIEDQENTLSVFSGDSTPDPANFTDIVSTAITDVTIVRTFS